MKLENGAEKLRVFIDEDIIPYESIARDEVLARSASNGASVLRFYTWSPAGISFGARQNKGHANFEKLAEDNVQLVRRHTGGTGIMSQSGEVNYTLAVPMKGIPDDDRKRIFCFFGDMIMKAFDNLGIDTVKQENEKPGPLANADCFSQLGRCEITSPEGRKIHAGAFNWDRDVYIQQGQIALDKSFRSIQDYLSFYVDPITNPMSAGEALGIIPTRHEFYDSLLKEFSSVFEIEQSVLSDSERNEINKLGNTFEITKESDGRYSQQRVDG